MALSGGGDSLALLRLAQAWAARAGRPVLALTVDHGLNPDSAAWTRFAAARAAESGAAESSAAFQALTWAGDKPASGLPAAARAARHALLAKAARDAGASVILLGHTADDTVETERMRGGDAPGIGRLRGWAPSPAWPQGRGVMLLRPLLGLHRTDLRRWLSERGERWLDDPANEDARYARVRARQTSEPAPAPGEALDEAAVARLAAGATEGAEGALLLPREALRAAPDAVARRVVSAAALCAGGGRTPPRGPQTEALLQRLRATDDGVSGLCGARVRFRAEGVTFQREPGDRARRPRPIEDGVIDGRYVEEDGAPRFLTYARFRAATFQIDREP